jgi:hypothetical protein
MAGGHIGHERRGEARVKRLLAGGAVAAAAAVTGTMVARRRSGTAATEAGRDRWHSVTINRSPEEVGPQPEPLAELGDTVELRVRPAPGGRGTELAARLAGEIPSGLGRLAAKRTGGDPVTHLRRALREAKQLAEIGEVLLPDRPPTTERTLTSRPLEYATRHGREEGRL